MKYFVSYTTRDQEVTKELLQAFSTKLCSYGEVYIDIINNNSIDKQARVITELDSSDLMLLIESNSIYLSEWVLLEIERAKTKHIPIKILKVKDIITFPDYIHSK